MSQRLAIFPEYFHALYGRHRYFPAVRSGDLRFVAGQVGSRSDGSPEPNLPDQVRLAYANLKRRCSPLEVLTPTTFFAVSGFSRKVIHLRMRISEGC